jgi:hypothetical protein
MLRKDETFWASGNVEFLGFIRAIDSGTIALGSGTTLISPISSK